MREPTDARIYRRHDVRKTRTLEDVSGIGGRSIHRTDVLASIRDGEYLFRRATPGFEVELDVSGKTRRCASRR